MAKGYKKYFLDTNFICSLLNVNDSNNIKAEEIFLKLPQNRKLISSELVLLELSGQKILPYSQVVAFLESQNVKFVPINRKNINEINRIYLQNNINLKPIDLSVFYFSVKYKTEILTFDQKLLKQLDKPIYKH